MFDLPLWYLWGAALSLSVLLAVGAYDSDSKNPLALLRNLNCLFLALVWPCTLLSVLWICIVKTIKKG